MRTKATSKQNNSTFLSQLLSCLIKEHQCQLPEKRTSFNAYFQECKNVFTNLYVYLHWRETHSVRNEQTWPQNRMRTHSFWQLFPNYEKLHVACFVSHKGVYFQTNRSLKGWVETMDIKKEVKNMCHFFHCKFMSSDAFFSPDVLIYLNRGWLSWQFHESSANMGERIIYWIHRSLCHRFLACEVWWLLLLSCQ